MHISEKGLKLIEQFEGYSSKRYLDSVGVPTIGYGTTASVVNPVPATCTQAQAEAWLRQYVERECEPAVNGLGVPLNQNQFDALCSLVYNCGPGSMGWQIGIDLRAKRYGAAANDFLRYTKARGQVLQGLVNRRTAERDLFLTLWKDPDPYHYAWFDNAVRLIGIRRLGSERALVQEYDAKRKHPHLPGRKARLDVLRADMGYLAGRLSGLGDPGKFRRKWRHDQLAGRAAGRRYV